MNVCVTPEIAVTTGPLPGSRKVYVASTADGSVKAPMREVALAPSAGETPLRLYDTSGPYSDSDASIDIRKGLPPLRAGWLQARHQVESYEARAVRPEDNGHAAGERLVPTFQNSRPPVRAKARRAVTQLAYVRAGIVTPEMEFVAIRENLGRDFERDRTARDGESFGAALARAWASPARVPSRPTRQRRPSRDRRCRPAPAGCAPPWPRAARRRG